MMSKRIPNITAEFEVHYIIKKYGLLRGVSFGGGVSFAGRWQYPPLSYGKVGGETGEENLAYDHVQSTPLIPF
jgi:hypothetical protein